MKQLEPGMPVLEVGGIYKSFSEYEGEKIFRVRAFQHWPKPGYESPAAVHRTSVLYDEIGPSGGFSLNSPHHATVVPHVLDADEDANVWMNEQSIRDMQKSIVHWRDEAIRYQNLAHARRPLWQKIYPPIVFFLVVIPMRAWSYYVKGYRGPWS